MFIDENEMGFCETNRIIVPSISTKEDLISMGARKDLIRVIPEAPLLPIVSNEEIEMVKKNINFVKIIFIVTELLQERIL